MDLHWPNCRNARDVGGLATTTGGRIRPGSLIRTDRLGQLTSAGLRAVRAAGVSRILDLRSHDECRDAPGPFTGEPSYRHMPVQDPTDPLDTTLTLAEVYRRLLDARPRLFAAAVAAVAEAPAGAVVVHCHAGKDRTGLVVALALTLADVATDVILDDYARSAIGLHEINKRGLARITDPAEHERVRDLWSAVPDTLSTALTHLRHEYGGARPYLAAGGLTDEHASALRDRLLA